MDITVAGLGDVHALQVISRETFSETFADQNSKDDLELFLHRTYSIEALTKELLNPDSTFYLLYDRNNLHGYLKVNRRGAQTEYQGEAAIEIERIYVKKQAKGHGYGKALLRKAIELSITEKLPFLWLGVWEKNLSAIGFYEKNGFTPFGEHIFMLGTDPQRDVLMKYISF